MGHKDWMDNCVCLLTTSSERMHHVPMALPKVVCALSLPADPQEDCDLWDPQAKDTKGLL